MAISKGLHFLNFLNVRGIKSYYLFWIALLTLNLSFFAESCSSRQPQELDEGKIIKDPFQEGVRFFVYTDPAYHPLESGIEVPYDNSVLRTNPGLNPEARTKLIIHGFQHNYSCWFPQLLKDAYLERGFQDNIITVDWGALAKNEQRSDLGAYKEAVENLPKIADEVVIFVSKFLDSGLISDLKDIHIIGFSLGAHLSGLVGHKLFEKYQEKVGRISGLDPAGPLFMSGLIGRTLESSDAYYVDVYHTDMGENGIMNALGHADFYVNGGFPPQPGCASGDSSCSHAAAPNYYWQSILNDRIGACPCGFAEHVFRTCNCNCDYRIRVPFGQNSVPGTAGKFCLNLDQMPLDDRYTC